jgi:DNA-3-methyladenine glycosylase I
MASAQPKFRCGWCDSSDLYRQYHDEEWGVPLTDEQALFRLLMLEGQQAGLAWITVLKKRAHMDQLFRHFDIDFLAAKGKERIEDWLQDPGIIRHRGKLEALVSNAQLVQAMPDFAEWIWSFSVSQSREPSTPVPAETAESQAMSKALKKAGFRFVGPTICYAFMQSAGMVNDHDPKCWRYAACERAVHKALKAR